MVTKFLIATLRPLTVYLDETFDVVSVETR
jgi:hypothetical protein